MISKDVIDDDLYKELERSFMIDEIKQIEQYAGQNDKMFYYYSFQRDQNTIYYTMHFYPNACKKANAGYPWVLKIFIKGRAGKSSRTGKWEWMRAKAYVDLEQPYGDHSKKENATDMARLIRNARLTFEELGDNIAKVDTTKLRKCLRMPNDERWEAYVNRVTVSALDKQVRGY